MRALAHCAALMTICVFAGESTFANMQNVKNIRVEVEDEMRVTITYDLEGELGAQFEVRVFLLREGDPNFKLKLSTVSGDIGRGRTAGRDLKIYWNAKVDYPEAVEGTPYRFEFEVAPHTAFPRLMSISPASAIQGDNLTLQITGEHFVQGVTSLLMGPGIAVHRLVIRSPMQLQAEVSISSDAVAGNRDVQVVNDSLCGEISEPRIFTIEESRGIPWYAYAGGGAAAATVLYFVLRKPEGPPHVVQADVLPVPPSLP